MYDTIYAVLELSSDNEYSDTVLGYFLDSQKAYDCIRNEILVLIENRKANWGLQVTEKEKEKTRQLLTTEIIDSFCFSHVVHKISLDKTYSNHEKHVYSIYDDEQKYYYLNYKDAKEKMIEIYKNSSEYTKKEKRQIINEIKKTGKTKDFGYYINKNKIY